MAAWRWLAVVLGCSLMAGAKPASVADVVRIGKSEVPAREVAEALEACHINAPTVAPVECIDHYWVPLWLLDREAQRRKIETSSSFANSRSAILAETFSERAQQAAPAPSAERVAAVMKNNPRDFARPARIRIFRILLSDEEEAKKLIARLGASPRMEDFRATARSHSIDKATHQRGGDLGFVWPDGTTEIPQVRAVPTLYQAAQEVEEGMLAPEPVREGDSFAVVLRRGTLPPRSMDDERARRLIQQRLMAEAAEEKLDLLVKNLRSHHLHEVHYDMLNRFKRPENKLFER